MFLERLLLGTRWILLIKMIILSSVRANWFFIHHLLWMKINLIEPILTLYSINILMHCLKRLRLISLCWRYFALFFINWLRWNMTKIQIFFALRIAWSIFLVVHNRHLLKIFLRWSLWSSFCWFSGVLSWWFAYLWIFIMTI